MKENEEENLNNEEINENVEMTELTEEEENDLTGGAGPAEKIYSITVRGSSDQYNECFNVHGLNADTLVINHLTIENNAKSKGLTIKFEKFGITASYIGKKIYTFKDIMTIHEGGTIRRYGLLIYCFPK